MRFRIPLTLESLEEPEKMLETIPLTVLVSRLSRSFEVETRFYLEVHVKEKTEEPSA